MRQKGVSKALASRGALDEPGNVDNVQERGEGRLGLVQLREPGEAVVGDVHTSLIREVKVCALVSIHA